MERPPARTFEDLVVWQRAHSFVLGVYEITKRFPRDETYGLSSQFRRASVSIAANIAEGFKKKGRQDKLRFLNIAHGSLEECRYYLVLTKDLGYAETDELRKKLEEVSTILAAYSNALR